MIRPWDRWRGKPNMPNRCVALVGCGRWGQNIARTLAELGALAAIVDADGGRAAAMAKQFDVPAYTDPAKAFADSAVLGCAVATPADLHFGVARQALEAGKDVFVEKPITTAIEDAIALNELAAKHSRILMVGHLLQYHPHFAALLKIVRSGELGRLYYAHLVRANLGQVRHAENALWSLAPHDMSMLLAIAGEMPRSVAAFGVGALQSSIQDAVMVCLDFPSGLGAHVFSSWINPFKEHKLTLSAERGMLVFDDTAPWEKKLAQYRHAFEGLGTPTPVSKAGPVDYIVPEADQPLHAEMRHFVECIETRRPALTDGAEALRVLRLLRACQHALEEKPRANFPG